LAARCARTAGRTDAALHTPGYTCFRIGAVSSLFGESTQQPSSEDFMWVLIIVTFAINDPPGREVRAGGSDAGIH